MTALDPDTTIDRWQAHVCFDEPSHDTAWALRELPVTALLGCMGMGNRQVLNLSTIDD